MKVNFLSILMVFISHTFFSQSTFPTNGAKDSSGEVICFKNGVIHTDADNTIENGSVCIHNGKILGVNIPVPNGAVIHDLRGKHIYASFIDLYGSYGMPVAQSKERNYGPQYESSKKGAFGWNETLNPERRASLMVKHDVKKAKSYRSMGIGTVLTHYEDGIHRGSGALLSLGTSENRNLLLPEAAAFLSFSKGKSDQSYPNSLMGVTALIRQTYYDAIWYSSSLNTLEENLTLAAWNELKVLPQIFETKEMLDILRADAIGEEFGIQYIFKGNGDEYQRLQNIKDAGGQVIVPVNFPLPFDVSDPQLSSTIELDELKHWELAPYNPFFMEDAGIDFCFTSHGLKDRSTFLKQVKKSIAHGLSSQAALRALTESPAKMIKMENELGRIQTGYWANFIITDKDVFSEGSIILENWVQGEKFEINKTKENQLAGDYNLSIDKTLYRLRIQKSGSVLLKESEMNKHDSLGVKVAFKEEHPFVSMSFSLKDETNKYLLTGANLTNGTILEGTGVSPDGSSVEWVAVKQNSTKKKKNPSTTSTPETSSDKTNPYDLLVYPFSAYGGNDTLEAEVILFKDVTLWTCDWLGKLDRGELLIADGIIKAVGERVDLEAVLGKKWEEVDIQIVEGYGMHVTPGIIDEHSHIAVSRGINESSQASTAEVRVGDVINSEDVNIYRQLAGGVTTSQLLHGSANPIGGQSALIKLRWGLSPEEMKFENASGFIKFALGENVKQSNWGENYRTRFPQSRMGVEQVFYDHFHKARAYDLEWKAYEESLTLLTKRQRKKGELPVEPRKDIELEALSEILNHERFITCHSYMQHEINMLMHVADSMGFTLNTFTHILEGYKLADKLKSHGAGASTFSDWWAYKYEVKDAIPHNGALLWENGITVAYNSDDAEMARRLNHEAAKAVKYGGVPEEEALKFVTLNPAKLLHIDHKVGSLTSGKDADIVLWDKNPLSVYAKPISTYVDGKCYFSAEKDRVLRAQMKQERNRIIQLMAAQSSSATRIPGKKKSQHYHCNTITNELH